MNCVVAENPDKGQRLVKTTTLLLQRGTRVRRWEHGDDGRMVVFHNQKKRIFAALIWNN
jgi:hypothetical protein